MQSVLKKSIDSFGYAIEGIKTGTRERNFKIHIVASLAAISLSLLLQISPSEWALIALCISSVMATELLNTAIEEVCNLMNQKLKLDYYDTWDPRNLAAGAVLITAIAAALVAALIFIPKIIALFA